MIKTLAIKELRESLGIATIAALGMAWAVASLMGVKLLGGILNFVKIYTYQSDMAFILDDFQFKAALFIGGLAVALGLKQTAWEHTRGTYHFLLHRPVSRTLVFATKIVVGIVLILLVLAAAILSYASWASAPGNQAVQFDWSMTLGAWRLALALPVVYLGAFLSGLRLASWFGTRLVPLAGAVLWAYLIVLVPAWWLALPMMLLGFACALAAIAYNIQKNDF